MLQLSDPIINTGWGISSIKSVPSSSTKNAGKANARDAESVDDLVKKTLFQTMMKQCDNNRKRLIDSLKE